MTCETTCLWKSIYRPASRAWTPGFILANEQTKTIFNHVPKSEFLVIRTVRVKEFQALKFRP